VYNEPAVPQARTRRCSLRLLPLINEILMLETNLKRRAAHYRRGTITLIVPREEILVPVVASKRALTPRRADK
jgi:hypothetical protein